MKLRMSLLSYVNTFLCSLNFFLSNANVNNLTLELVQVVFRHGARTTSYSGAVFLNLTNPPIYWPEGYDQLTNEGKQQMYTLGTSLRKKYNNFLSVYNPKEHHAWTSNYSRTIMSLQLVLGGLFPPSTENLWNNKLHWDPVSFHHNSLEIMMTLAPFRIRRYNDLFLKTFAESSEFQRKFSKYTEFIEFLTNKTGLSIMEKFPGSIGHLYYGIGYHKRMNLPLPSWYKNDSIYITLREVYKLTLEGMSWTPQLKRMNGGLLVRQLITNINENWNGTVPKKIYLYSTHDMTINSFAKSQNLNAFAIPPFAGTLIMEKYKDFKNSEFLKMLSWDPTDSENFKVVKIGSCNEMCPLDDYLEIVKDNFSTDEDIKYLKNDILNYSVQNWD